MEQPPACMTELVLYVCSRWRTVKTTTDLPTLLGKRRSTPALRTPGNPLVGMRTILPSTLRFCSPHYPTHFPRVCLDYGRSYNVDDGCNTGVVNTIPGCLLLPRTRRTTDGEDRTKTRLHLYRTDATTPVSRRTTTSLRPHLQTRYTKIPGPGLLADYGSHTPYSV